MKGRCLPQAVGRTVKANTCGLKVYSSGHITFLASLKVYNVLTATLKRRQMGSCGHVLHTQRGQATSTSSHRLRAGRPCTLSPPPHPLHPLSGELGRGGSKSASVCPCAGLDRKLPGFHCYSYSHPWPVGCCWWDPSQKL